MTIFYVPAMDFGNDASYALANDYQSRLIAEGGSAMTNSAYSFVREIYKAGADNGATAVSGWLGGSAVNPSINKLINLSSTGPFLQPAGTLNAATVQKTGMLGIRVQAGGQGYKTSDNTGLFAGDNYSVLQLMCSAGDDNSPSQQTMHVVWDQQVTADAGNIIDYIDTNGIHYFLDRPGSQMNTAIVNRDQFIDPLFYWYRKEGGNYQMIHAGEETKSTAYAMSGDPGDKPFQLANTMIGTCHVGFVAMIRFDGVLSDAQRRDIFDRVTKKARALVDCVLVIGNSNTANLNWWVWPKQSQIWGVYNNAIFTRLAEASRALNYFAPTGYTPAPSEAWTTGIASKPVNLFDWYAPNLIVNDEQQNSVTAGNDWAAILNCHNAIISHFAPMNPAGMKSVMVSQIAHAAYKFATDGSAMTYAQVQTERTKYWTATEAARRATSVDYNNVPTKLADIWEGGNDGWDTVDDGNPPDPRHDLPHGTDSLFQTYVDATVTKIDPAHFNNLGHAMEEARVEAAIDELRSDPATASATAYETRLVSEGGSTLNTAEFDYVREIYQAANDLGLSIADAWLFGSNVNVSASKIINLVAGRDSLVPLTALHPQSVLTRGQIGLRITAAGEGLITENGQAFYTGDDYNVLIIGQSAIDSYTSSIHSIVSQEVTGDAGNLVFYGSEAGIYTLLDRPSSQMAVYPLTNGRESFVNPICYWHIKEGGNYQVQHAGEQNKSTAYTMGADPGANPFKVGSYYFGTPTNLGMSFIIRLNGTMSDAARKEFFDRVLNKLSYLLDLALAVGNSVTANGMWETWTKQLQIWGIYNNISTARLAEGGRTLNYFAPTGYVPHATETYTGMLSQRPVNIYDWWQPTLIINDENQNNTSYGNPWAAFLNCHNAIVSHFAAFHPDNMKAVMVSQMAHEAYTFPPTHDPLVYDDPGSTNDVVGLMTPYYNVEVAARNATLADYNNIPTAFAEQWDWLSSGWPTVDDGDPPDPLNDLANGKSEYFATNENLHLNAAGHLMWFQPIRDAVASLL